MNGPSHPGSPPSCGFSKKVNVEKYAFNVLNISGIYQSISHICANLTVASRWRYHYNGILNIQMCSGQDSYQTCEVWGRLNILCLSYNNFSCRGKTSNFVMAPWKRPLTKTQDLQKLTLHRPLD